MRINMKVFMKTQSFKVDKLVRDNIPDFLRAKGITVDERVMDTNEYAQRLKEKLIEEGLEVLRAKKLDKLIEEIGDVMEVVYALAEALGVSFEEIESRRLAKRDASGGFARRIYSAKVEMEASNPATHYYKQRPDDYPEI